MNPFNRRKFMQSAAILAAASQVKLAKASTFNSNQPIIIDLNLRGGMDGLTVLPPMTGVNRQVYETVRPNLAVPLTGNKAVLDIGDFFGFHFNAPELRDMYTSGDMAIINGVGVPDNFVIRSHFDAIKYQELGTLDTLSTPDGWLTRHLETSPIINGQESIPAVVTGSTKPDTLKNYIDVLTIYKPKYFHPNFGRQGNAHLESMEDMYAGTNGEFEMAAASSVEYVNLLKDLDLENYEPDGGADYPAGGFGTQLKLIAQLLKGNHGIHVASTDFGGWDTHNGQGDQGGGYIGDKIKGLSKSISAFWTDLKASGFGDKVIITIHSEFGRRVRQNGSGNCGTDHGSGNAMFVIGGKVNGGQHYGEFVGLENHQLFEGEDLQAVVDYRQVFSTITKEFLNNPNINLVFPGYTGYQPLGFLDTPPDTIFKSGFE